MSLGRIHRPVVDAGRCQSCCVCLRGCPAEVLPELQAEAATVRSAVYGSPSGEHRTESPPCEAACPLGQRVREYVGAMAQGRWREALLTIREDNPLPAVCGTLCSHPCQTECLRGTVDGPVTIRELKQMATRFEREHGEEVQAAMLARRLPSNGKRVAIVGSGPAGLTAAHDLVMAGCQVTLVEAEPELGGALRLAIPAFRLPREALDRDIEMLLRLGIRVEAGRPVTGTGDLEQLRAEGYDAVLLALGAQRGAGLPVPGWEGSECVDALRFLREFNDGRVSRLAGTTLVVGGGNVALDAARAALRCGSTEVSVVYRRDREHMPVDPEELADAEAEGVGFSFRTLPKAVERQDGRISGLVCQATELGPPDGSGRPSVVVADRVFRLPAARVIAAVGQAADHPCLPPDARRQDGRALVEVGHRVTGQPGLFAAGDGVTGPSYVVDAMASARAAARNILSFLEVPGNEP